LKTIATDHLANVQNNLQLKKGYWMHTVVGWEVAGEFFRLLIPVLLGMLFLVREKAPPGWGREMGFSVGKGRRV